MPSLEDNHRLWTAYGWPLDGDEWTDQAEYCGVPYDQWKQSITTEFLAVTDTDVVAEIGCGRGRWTAELVGRCGAYVGFDVVEHCIERCRERFPTAQFWLGDGRSLALHPESVNLVWAYDTFVHFDAPTIEAYLREIERVLQPWGHAWIHHTGWPTPAQRARGKRDCDAGTFAALARQSGLVVDTRVDAWPGGNCRLFNDYLTKLVRASAP